MPIARQALGGAALGVVAYCHRAQIAVSLLETQVDQFTASAAANGCEALKD